ncbi:hypothetical protein [Gordonia sp. 'Campus']|uniref:hypothetical protein n=1 Tax=Gordonia sp. 'Campus' TaxID=2915824 RepID=UPI001EE406DE|nr:hypothetical protein [Gordonia sp. 'Campus']
MSTPPNTISREEGLVNPYERGSGSTRMDARVLNVMLPVLLVLSACATNDVKSPVHAQMLGEAGYGFVSDSVGLSIESSTLAGDAKSLQVEEVARAFKSFRPGMVLRVGGNTSDEMFWTSKGEALPDGYRFRATPTGLQRLATLTEALGWRVVMGVNLRSRDSARAADMVKHARAIFGDRLVSAAIGNEPNVYYPPNPPFGTYLSDVKRYSEAIRNEVSDIDIQAPDSSGNRYDFIWSSASQFARSPSAAPSVYAAHFYGSRGCGSTTMDPSLLFSDFAYEARDESLTDISRAASIANSPKVVLSEANSVNCGGIAGVSNRLAGALWILDFALDATTRGFNGIYFHGTLTDCIAYSPLCVGEDKKIGKGDTFKAMAVLNGLANGMAMLQVVPAEKRDNLRIYGLKGNKSLALVVINTGENVTDRVPVEVDLPGDGYVPLEEVEMSTEDESSQDGTRLSRKTTLRGVPPDLDSACGAGQKHEELTRVAEVDSAPASAKVLFFCEL